MMVSFGRTPRHARDGFTLIELIIAMGILAALMAVAIPAFMGYLERANKSSTYGNLKSIKAAIDMYKIDTARYPNRLRELVQKPREEAIARKWEGPYLEGGEIPEDSWDEAIQYKRTPEGKNPYELYSYGPDGAGSPKSDWLSVWDR